jgi:hypothetical protein
MTVKRAWLAVLGVAMLGSQAGHLLAYQVRFGAAATQMQSSGVHAYFPGVVRTSLGVIAALVLAGLFLVGVARILSGRPTRPGSAPNLLRLLAVLYTLQLAWFAGQEVGEALLAGMPVDSVAHLLLWGTLGQLPIAVIAAASLRWLMARFESAITEIRVALATLPTQVSTLRVTVPVWSNLNRDLILRSVAGASLAKRGPPSSLRESHELRGFAVSSRELLISSN